MREKFEWLESRLTDIFLCLMFSVFLFGVSPEGYERISETKYLLFCILCGGYCVIMLLLTLQKRVICGNGPYVDEMGKGLMRSGERRLKNGFTACLFLYLILTAVSGFLSEYGAATLIGPGRREGILTIWCYGLVCFFVMRTHRRKHGEFLLLFAGAAVLLFDGICLLQLLNRNPLRLYPGDFTYADRYREYGGAFLGTTGNADLTSAFLTLMIPFFAVIFLRCRKKRSPVSVLSAAAACFSSVILVWSGVLAGIVGTAVSLIVLFPSVLGMNRKKSFVWYGTVVLITVCCLAFLFFSSPAGSNPDGRENGTDALQPVREIQQILHGNISDSAGSGRIHIYRQVWDLIGEKPFFGGGPDTLVFRETDGFRRYDDTRQKYIETYIDTAHSEYLNIAVCQGVPALIAYLGILICGLMHAVRRKKELRACACGAAVFAYAVQACFGFSMYITAPFFWIFLGLMTASPENEEDEAAEKSASGGKNGKIKEILTQNEKNI